MRCKHCGFVNGEDDHRCLRCGRRLSGAVVAQPVNAGANALAPSAMTNGDTDEFPPVAKSSVPAPEQPPLFSTWSQPAGTAGNVIPFDRLQREAAGKAPVRTQVTQPAPAPQPRARRSGAPPPQDTQGTLDFVAGNPLKARRLKTNVDAQVFCDRPVATPIHRFVAGAIDGALVLIGFGVLVLTFQLAGGRFGGGKMLWIGIGATLALVTMLYGLIWAIAGRETAGMRLTDLQLITFDGFPLDPRSRALRFISSWLSFYSGGLGVLWALADEENLTWHDHISKTFPTIREVPRSFVKQRR